MSWITARRRHPAAGYAILFLGLLLVGALYASVTGGGVSASAAPPALADSAQISQGHTIFLADCATCHGMGAQGQSGVAPALIGVGAAAVDFQVSTGRMPAAELGAENPRKPPKLDPAQTHAVAAYIASLGGGPA
ncbi:MAG: c-type cytochrome, partial [Streptosporangiaceae bacterium]